MPSSDFRLHAVHRDSTEKYLVVLGQGDIAVFNATTGALATTNITAEAATYLANGAPVADELRAVTVADYTIILNTKVTAAVKSSQASFYVEEVFDSWTKMISRLPTASQYFRTTVDDGGRKRGFYQYALSAADNGFAKWTRDTAVAQSWRRQSGKWNDLSRNPMGFRVRFKRTTFADTGLDYDATGHTQGNHRLYKSGAFTNYTHDAGNEIYINADGDVSLPEGWYPIASRVDNNAILLTDNGETPAGVDYRDASDVEQTYADSIGNKSDSDCADIFVSASVTENFNSSPAADMDDVAERLQSSLQSAGPGCEDAIIYWDDPNHKFHIISPFRGTAATVLNITAPAAAADFDLSQAVGGKPFDFSDGTATAGSGSPATDTDLIEDRWENVPAPGDGDSTPDETTLPIKLVRTTVSPLVFDADVIDWKPRLTGTHDSNPAPSIFIDQDGAAAGITLSDLTFHRNRFGLGGDENIVFGGDGDFFNLFIEDSDNIVDSDPIDRALSSTQVTIVDFIVPYRKSLMIFTKSGRQFEMNAPEAFTPNTVSITESTSYHTTPNVRPKRIHESLYFTGPDGLRAKLYRLRALADSPSTRADVVSAHAFELLPSDIKSLVVWPDEDMVFILPRDNNIIYVYQTFYRGTQSEQLAWGKWTFNSNQEIDDIAIIEDVLFLLVHDTVENARILEKIELADVLANIDLSGGQSLPVGA